MKEWYKIRRLQSRAKNSGGLFLGINQFDNLGDLFDKNFLSEDSPFQNLRGPVSSDEWKIAKGSIPKSVGPVCFLAMPNGHLISVSISITGKNMFTP
jgi:hypothetical protein